MTAGAQLLEEQCYAFKNRLAGRPSQASKEPEHLNPMFGSPGFEASGLTLIAACYEHGLRHKVAPSEVVIRFGLNGPTKSKLEELIPFCVNRHLPLQLGARQGRAVELPWGQL